MTEHLPQEAPATVAFVDRLLAALPSLRPRYERIVGELQAEGVDSQGAAFLVSEYTRELLENFDAAGQFDERSERSERSELAAALEREYGVEAAVDNVIESGFVLQMERRAGGDPADLLGPKLRRLVDEERAWRAAPAEAALVERMLAVVPGLRELTDENRWGDHGDVLVHGFLSDVVRREVENVEAGHVEEPRAVIQLLESLCSVRRRFRVLRWLRALRRTRTRRSRCRSSRTCRIRARPGRR